ncbi:unnamed protein product, partial [marine sediment metagenome]
EISKINETESIDIKTLNPASDFLIFELKPVKNRRYPDTTLLIKASAMEWETIDFQIEHIIEQLEGPQVFSEIVVITDRFKGPFLRQYTKPNHIEFENKLIILKDQGYIDKIVFAPLEKKVIEKLFKKWFGYTVEESHCQNQQHLYTTLYGFETCKSDYILQLDSDCIIARINRDVDYLEDMIEIFNKDKKAITVAFNIAKRETKEYHITISNM